MELTPAQMRTIERFLASGFRPVSIEHVERYLPVEKNGFVALLDTSGSQVTVFGQVGYRMGDGIGMLVERGAGKTFVRHGEAVSATPELLAAYEAFIAELQVLVEEGSVGN